MYQAIIPLVRRFGGCHYDFSTIQIMLRKLLNLAKNKFDPPAASSSASQKTASFFRCLDEFCSSCGCTPRGGGANNAGIILIIIGSSAATFGLSNQHQRKSRHERRSLFAATCDTVVARYESYCPTFCHAAKQRIGVHEIITVVWQPQP
jgi:hypothetical protein